LWLHSNEERPFILSERGLSRESKPRRKGESASKRGKKALRRWKCQGKSERRREPFLVKKGPQLKEDFREEECLLL